MRGQGWRRGTSRLLELLLGGALVLALVPAAAHASVSVDDVSVAEGNGGDVVATFTVTRTGGLLTGGTTVGFATGDGSAHAPADYTAYSGSLSFGSLPLGGTQTQQVPVTVKGDLLDEPAETFRLVLSGPEVADAQGTATVEDNDPPPTVNAIDAPAAPEGATATFTIALSAPSGRDVSVSYATVDGSAVAGQDYAPTTGTATIAAGATSTPVGVALLDDADDEATESFGLAIGTPVNATRGTASATATILDTDEPPAPASPASNANSAGGSTTASPPLSPNAIGPPGGVTGAGTSQALPRLGVSSPRLRRPSTILVTVSCPRSASLCDGQVTVFSRPSLRSKIKLLRKERRLGARLFKLKPGVTRTLQIALSKTDRVLLLRTGRMNVRAFAVTEDAAGKSGVRRVTGTLIARTTHS
jgi:hypothetical protein